MQDCTACHTHALVNPPCSQCLDLLGRPPPHPMLAHCHCLAQILLAPPVNALVPAAAAAVAAGVTALFR
eukprot:1156706-Pelagomonas_calceolata.AAC.14